MVKVLSSTNLYLNLKDQKTTIQDLIRYKDSETQEIQVRRVISKNFIMSLTTVSKKHVSTDGRMSGGEGVFFKRNSPRIPTFTISNRETKQPEYLSNTLTNSLTRYLTFIQSWSFITEFRTYYRVSVDQIEGFEVLSWAVSINCRS